MIVCAEETKGTFFIKPLLPTNQKQSISDYFDLEMKPGAEQLVQISVHNESEEEMEFTGVVEQAVTNDYGVIEYVHEMETYDESLEYPLAELVKVDESVKVKAGGSEVLEAKIIMPEKEFEGVILGGIRVMEKTDEATVSGISNVFSYVMPLKIYQKESTLPQKLVFHDVSFGKQDGHNVVKAFLQNPQADLLRGLSLEAKVVDLKSEKVLYEENRDDMKLAPNSNFSFPISMGTDKVKAGKYRLDLVAKAEGIDEKWSKEFEVRAEKAKELNNELVIKSGVNWKNYLLIAGLVSAIFIILFLIYRQRKLVEQTKKSKRSKKMKKKRMKKHQDKLVLFLLVASCFSLHTGIVEATSNNGVSDATIVLKKTKEPTQPPVETKPTSPSTNIKKVLPQTGSKPQSYLVMVLGSSLLGSTAIFIGLQIKSERGKKYAK